MKTYYILEHKGGDNWKIESKTGSKSMAKNILKGLKRNYPNKRYKLVSRTRRLIL